MPAGHWPKSRHPNFCSGRKSGDAMIRLRHSRPPFKSYPQQQPAFDSLFLSFFYLDQGGNGDLL